MNCWPVLPWAFPWLLGVCEESWKRHELATQYGAANPYPPPYVTAVAAMFGVDGGALWDHVEGVHGWEPHDDGYGQAVWAALWCTSHGPAPAAAVRLRAGLGAAAGGWGLVGDNLVGPWRWRRP